MSAQTTSPFARMATAIQLAKMWFKVVCCCKNSKTCHSNWESWPPRKWQIARSTWFYAQEVNVWQTSSLVQPHLLVPLEWSSALTRAAPNPKTSVLWMFASKAKSGAGMVFALQISRVAQPDLAAQTTGQSNARVTILARSAFWTVQSLFLAPNTLLINASVANAEFLRLNAQFKRLAHPNCRSSALMVNVWLRNTNARKWPICNNAHKDMLCVPQKLVQRAKAFAHKLQPALQAKSSAGIILANKNLSIVQNWSKKLQEHAHKADR